MEKLFKHFLLCLIPLVLTACQAEMDRPKVSEETLGTAGQESTGRENDTLTNDTQTADEYGMLEEVKANTSEAEKASVYAGSNESQDPAADYVLPDSASRLYSQQELEALSLEEMRLARNELYARHGRQFKDSSLQEYFKRKAWYQGTVAPDEFDDDQLNQRERDNLSLLLRLEQEALNGRSGYPTPPYAEAFADWDSQHEHQKVCEKLYSDGTGTILSSEDSKVIVHSQFYEISDCQVWVDDVYDRSLFDGKKLGDEVTIDGESFVIDEMTGDDGNRSYKLLYVIQEGHTRERPPEGWVASIRLQECSEGFYEKMDNDLCGPSRLIYEGSLYFYIDARINAGMMDGQETITAQEYFEIPAPGKEDYRERDSFGGFTRAGGLQKDGSIWLYGIPSYDDDYYITGFTEVSRNWVG